MRSSNIHQIYILLNPCMVYYEKHYKMWNVQKSWWIAAKVKALAGRKSIFTVGFPFYDQFRQRKWHSEADTYFSAVSEIKKADRWYFVAIDQHHLNVQCVKYDLNYVCFFLKAESTAYKSWRRQRRWPCLWAQVTVVHWQKRCNLKCNHLMWLFWIRISIYTTHKLLHWCKSDKSINLLRSVVEGQ